MSLIKSFGGLTIQTRTFVSRKVLHPKKFTSILDNVPVKPRSAWQIYFRENIGKQRDANGKLNMGETSKNLSQTWKTLGEQEKSVYHQKFTEESKAHAEGLEKALNSASPKQFHDENLLRKKYNLKLLRDPKQPKRPKNSFMMYLDHLRSVNDPIFTKNDVKTQVVEAAKKYRALPANESKIYMDQAKDAFSKYQNENAKYLELIK